MQHSCFLAMENCKSSTYLQILIGTNGQEVRQIPFRPIRLNPPLFGVAVEIENISNAFYLSYLQKTYRLLQISSVLFPSWQFCSKFKKSRHWFSRHPHR